MKNKIEEMYDESDWEDEETSHRKFNKNKVRNARKKRSKEQEELMEGGE